MPGSSSQNIPPALRGDRRGNQIFWYKDAAEIFPLTEYRHGKVVFATLLSRQRFCFILFSQEWCRSLWRQCRMTSWRHSNSRESRCGIPANYSTQNTCGEKERNSYSQLEPPLLEGTQHFTSVVSVVVMILFLMCISQPCRWTIIQTWRTQKMPLMISTIFHQSAIQIFCKCPYIQVSLHQVSLWDSYIGIV